MAYDLAPNVCAVYTEADRRCQGIAGALLNSVCADMKERGIDTLYLATDHTSFYERYGWEFLCMAQGDGEAKKTRMYTSTGDNGRLYKPDGNGCSPAYLSSGNETQNSTGPMDIISPPRSLLRPWNRIPSRAVPCGESRSSI